MTTIPAERQHLLDTLDQLRERFSAALSRAWIWDHPGSTDDKIIALEEHWPGIAAVARPAAVYLASPTPLDWPTLRLTERDVRRVEEAASSIAPETRTVPLSEVGSVSPADVGATDTPEARGRLMQALFEQARDRYHKLGFWAFNAYGRRAAPLSAEEDSYLGPSDADQRVSLEAALPGWEPLIASIEALITAWKPPVALSVLRGLTPFRTAVRQLELAAVDLRSTEAEKDWLRRAWPAIEDVGGWFDPVPIGAGGQVLKARLQTAGINPPTAEAQARFEELRDRWRRLAAWSVVHKLPEQQPALNAWLAWMADWEAGNPHTSQIADVSATVEALERAAAAYDKQHGSTPAFVAAPLTTPFDTDRRTTWQAAATDTQRTLTSAANTVATFRFSTEAKIAAGVAGATLLGGLLLAAHIHLTTLTGGRRR